MKLSDYLLKLAPKQNPIRAKRIYNTKLVVLGYKTFDIKNLAKDIINYNDINNIELILNNCEFKIIEELFLYVIVISYLPFKPFYKYLFKIIPHIDSWAVTDMVIYHNYKKELIELDEIIKKLLVNPNNFAKRTAFILRMKYYINDNYIDMIINEIISNEKTDDYYLMMVIAWLMQLIYLKYPEKITWLLFNKLSNKFIIRKTISKIYDSYKVSRDEKTTLKDKLTLFLKGSL